MSVDPVLAQVARLGLIGLFASAALHKLRGPRAFIATLRDYRITPAALAPALAVCVVVAEVAICAALAAAPPAGAAGAAVLLALYSGAIGLNLSRGRRHIDCGCLGPAARQPLSAWLLVRNAGLAAGCLLILAPPASRALGWVDGFSIAATLAVLLLLWDAAHRLGGLPQRSA